MSYRNESVSSFISMLGRDTFVEDIIYGVQNRHVDMEALVDVLHTFGAVIPSAIISISICAAFHTVPLAYHGTEHPVATEVGISRDEKVAQIDRIMIFRSMGCTILRKRFISCAALDMMTDWKLSPYFRPLQIPAAMA